MRRAEAADVAVLEASNSGNAGPQRSPSPSPSPSPAHSRSRSPTSSTPKDPTLNLSAGRGRKRAWSEEDEGEKREEGEEGEEGEEREERSSARTQQQQEKRIRLGDTDKESGDRRQSLLLSRKGNTIQSDGRQWTGWSQGMKTLGASEGKVCARACASQACKEADQREQRPADAILDIADIGPLLGSGKTGRVYRCKSESENLAIKMFLEIDSFNREYSAYQIMHAAATQVSMLVPRFYEKALLPRELLHRNQSFLDYDSSEDEDEDEEEVAVPLPPCGLILERLRGPIFSQVLSPKKKFVLSSYLTELHESLRATLTAIHELGIVHTDLKENNLMFQTESTTPDNCCIIDFGHAEFKSQLSSQSWKRKCESDNAELNSVFCEAEARLAIKLGLEFLKSNTLNFSPALSSVPKEPVDAEALLDQYDHPRKEGNYLEFLISYSTHPHPESLQTRLAIILKFASRRAVQAKPLINRTLSMIPNPTPLLALSLVNILFDASRQKTALDLLNSQLNDSSMHPLISARFHERKLQYVVEGKCIWKAHISVLKRALPIFVAAYGEKSVEVLAAKHKLGTAYKLDGEKDLAREISFESVSDFERICTDSGGNV